MVNLLPRLPIKTLPSFHKQILRAMGDDYSDDLSDYYPTDTSYDTTDTTDSSSQGNSILTGILTSVGTSAVNAAKNALGVQTVVPTSTIRRPLTSTLPSWVIPAALVAGVLLVVSSKKG